MYYFKAEWIILQIKKISEKELLYKIFFKEYGILMVKKQKKTREKWLDIWYHISTEIITHDTDKQTIPTITNIKIKNYFSSDWKNHKSIMSFLLVLMYVEDILPLWTPNDTLYNWILIFLTLQDAISPTSHLLFKLKVRNYNWELISHHQDQDIRKILQFIENNSMQDILKLRKIPEDIEKKLERFI